jgi:hypothetical protein
MPAKKMCFWGVSEKRVKCKYKIGQNEIAHYKILIV